MQPEAISSHPVIVTWAETKPQHQLELNSKMLQCPVSIAEKSDCGETLLTEIDSSRLHLKALPLEFMKNVCLPLIPIYAMQAASESWEGNKVFLMPLNTLTLLCNAVLDIKL